MCLCSEWQYYGGPGFVEEQCGQAFRGNRRLYDLLLCYSWLQLLPAQEGLPHLQKEIPLSMFGEIQDVTFLGVSVSLMPFVLGYCLSLIWFYSSQIHNVKTGLFCCSIICLSSFYSTNGLRPATSPPVHCAEKPSSKMHFLLLVFFNQPWLRRLWSLAVLFYWDLICCINIWFLGMKWQTLFDSENPVPCALWELELKYHLYHSYSAPHQ